MASSNIALNVGILCLFKYYGFFAENLSSLFGLFGWQLDPVTLDILLPAGISFYTFQAIGYTLDVYRRHIDAARDFVAFAAFISFFPQLLAGPIERAASLYSQFLRQRVFDYAGAKDGCRLILWGFFKKLAIADGAAAIVNMVYADVEGQNPSMLFVAAVLFAFQIYGDFSGYSDIAVGTARLFGIQLSRNFVLPYLSRDIAEFWRRWHITLNAWFRDYVYIPLGGSRVSRLLVVRNTFAIFLLSGLWHGANWTFVAWGTYHAVLFLPLVLFGRNRRHTGVVAARSRWPAPAELLQIITTFSLVTVGWVLFRAENIGQAILYLDRMFNLTAWQVPSFGASELSTFSRTLLAIAVLVCLEWHGRRAEHPLCWKCRMTLRWCAYLCLAVWCILSFTAAQAFIYFRF